MGDAALSALKAAFETATSWSELATAIVVAGVAIEFLALLIFSKEMSRAEKSMLVIGSLLVVAGVGGEYVFGSRAAHIAAELQQQSDQTVAGLKAQQEADHKIATEAAAHAADLGVSIDTLHSFVDDQKKKNDDVIAELQNDETRLATARDDALKAATDSRDVLKQMNDALDAEKSVRAKMLSAIEPRTIKPDQRATLLTLLRLVEPKGDVTISAKLFDEEAEAFAKQISAALKEAGFNVKDLRGAFSFGVPGQFIALRDLKKWQTGPSWVGELQNALTSSLGLHFEGSQMDGTFKPEDGDVLIVISSKP